MLYLSIHPSTHPPIYLPRKSRQAPMVACLASSERRSAVLLSCPSTWRMGSMKASKVIVMFSSSTERMRRARVVWKEVRCRLLAGRERKGKCSVCIGGWVREMEGDRWWME